MGDIDNPNWNANVARALQKGTVIPAVPLAQTTSGEFDEKSQKALLRYYADSGVGGIAVGVHSTQFNIRDPGVDLLETVLRVSSETIDEWCGPVRPIIKIAGIVGETDAAISEAVLARKLGYHIGLVSLAALPDATDEELVTHCEAVAEVLPIMGFYLQPAVGGRFLSENFWKNFAQIKKVVAIKVSPFNRYQTLDVVKGIARSGRVNEIALYTGNDDNIVGDLLTTYKLAGPEGEVTTRFVGGLLGHWSVWTSKVVELFRQIQSIMENGSAIPPDLLEIGVQITDMNAVLFDARNSFAGCLPGIHEVLRRQGLRETNRCLDPRESLSPGQADEIDRLYLDYPHLTDDEFVRANLDKWMH